MTKRELDEILASRNHFNDFKLFTKLPEGSPSWIAFWEEERRRSLEGYHFGSDYISGYFYWYLNYNPIYLTKVTHEGEDRSSGDRVYDFPDYWDGVKKATDYINEAELSGQHVFIGGSRGKSKSFLIAAMLNRNYFHIEGSNNFLVASDLSYLTGADGTLSKTWQAMDFADQHTPWAKRRQVHNTHLHRRSSKKVKDSKGVEREAGWMSDILGVTVGDDYNKMRGKRGKLIALEESGNFRNLDKLHQTLRPGMEDGNVTFGTIAHFGCVCAGTKVWNKFGEQINIENVTEDSGIIGFKNNKVNIEPITYIQEKNYKNCVRITTKFRILECSEDHPILVRKLHTKRTSDYKLKNQTPREKQYEYKFIEAGKLGKGKVKNVIVLADKIDIFSTEKLFDSRLVGMLIGDGSYGLRKHYNKTEYKTPSFSNCDKELLDYILNKYSCNIECQRLTKDGRLYHEISIRNLIPELKKIGIAGQSKTKKRLPLNYQKLNKLDSSLLLAGLFDTDGTVNIYQGEVQVKGCISITQSSKEILDQIQILLLKFGIYSSICKINPTISPNRKDKNPWYMLSIQEKKSLFNFIDEIPLLIEYKKNNLKKIKESYLKLIPHRRLNTLLGTREETVQKVENIGIKQIYNLTANDSHTYLANNIITHNTGGTTGASSQGFHELMKNPRAYRIYPVKNFTDPGMEDTENGFFFPANWNYKGAYDKLGKSDIVRADELINKEIEIVKKAGDPYAVIRRTAELPRTVSEMLMRISGTQFPILELKRQEGEIESKPHMYRNAEFHAVFELEREAQGFIWKNDPDPKPIYNFPHFDNKNKPGCFIIYEHPKTDKDNKVYSDRYIAGLDSYDFDESTTTSLGVMYIMDWWTGRIVAEYCGRPPRAFDFYEMCRRGLLYYNARANIENANKGIFTYFEGKGCSYLICDELRISKEAINDPSLNGKGTKPSKPLNAYARGLYAQYLLESTDNSDKPEELMVHKLKSIALIKETILWNIDGNYDRVSAMCMLILLYYEKKKYQIDGTYTIPKNYLGNDPYFEKLLPGHLKRNSYLLNK